MPNIPQGILVAFGVTVTFVLSGGASTKAQACTPQDADCDGISDRIEDALLATFRPFFRFSRDSGSNETFRPTDVRTYLLNSEVDGTGSEGERVLLSNRELAGSLDRLLALTVDGHSSNITQNPTRTDYHINPANGARRGAEWSEARASRRIGLYGHVVPIHLQSPEQYRREDIPSSAGNALPLFYKIEYWQFFGYSSNDKPGDQGDHEGDWDTVQVIIRPANPRTNTPVQLMTVLFYAHGKEMRFDMSTRIGDVPMDGGLVKEVRGSQYNKPVPNLHDDGAEAKAANHVLRLFKDPVTGEFTHPVVFVEHGGHEFWPSPFWEFTAAQKHGGDDTDDSYLTDTPPNLGEVEHPRSEDPVARLILQFNGYWGTYSRELPGIFSNNPPPGPPLHYEWTWPATSSIRWRLSGIEY